MVFLFCVVYEGEFWGWWHILLELKPVNSSATLFKLTVATKGRQLLSETMFMKANNLLFQAYSLVTTNSHFPWGAPCDWSNWRRLGPMAASLEYIIIRQLSSSLLLARRKGIYVTINRITVENGGGVPGLWLWAIRHLLNAHTSPAQQSTWVA